MSEQVSIVGYMNPDDGFLNKHCHNGYTDAVVLKSDYDALLQKVDAMKRTQTWAETELPKWQALATETRIERDEARMQVKELQRQVAELTNQRDAILLQARCWAGEAKAQQAITKAIGETLGGIPNWGPIAAGVEALRKRARTAEREAAEALRTLKGLEKVAKVVDANSDQVCGENNMLRQEVETWHVHFNAMQLQRNHHRDAAAKLRTELEAARGLLRHAAECMRDAAFIIDSSNYRINGAAATIHSLRTLADELTATSALEVTDHLRDSAKMVEQGERQEVRYMVTIEPSTPLYAFPPRVADVSALVDALVDALRNVEQTSSSTRLRRVAANALAAHRKAAQ